MDKSDLASPKMVLKEQEQETNLNSFNLSNSSRKELVS